MKADLNVAHLGLLSSKAWGFKASLLTGTGLLLGAGVALLLPDLIHIGRFDAYSIGALIAAFGCAGAGLLAWAAERDEQAGQLQALTDSVAHLQSESRQQHQKIRALEAWMLASDKASYPEQDTQQIKSELRVLQQLLGQVIKERSKPVATRPVNLHAVNVQTTLKDVTQPVPAALTEATILSVMRSALEDSRIDLYLQPIVRLPSRNIIHYEAFSRVRDEYGDIIFPVDYLKPAGTAGLVATLDNLLLFRCINLIRKLGQRKQGTAIFLNLASGSLSDPAFMADFVGFMTAHKELAERLVFEVAADVLPRLDQGIMAQLKILSRAGYTFSIDHVTDLGINFSGLADWNVRYVKIEAATLLEESSSFAGPSLKQHLSRFHIELIATHIEDERTVVDILDLGISYGQGYLFGTPRPAKQDLPDKPASRTPKPLPVTKRKTA